MLHQWGFEWQKKLASLIFRNYFLTKAIYWGAAAAINSSEWKGRSPNKLVLWCHLQMCVIKHSFYSTLQSTLANWWRHSALDPHTGEHRPQWEEQVKNRPRNGLRPNHREDVWKKKKRLSNRPDFGRPRANNVSGFQTL